MYRCLNQKCGQLFEEHEGDYDFGVRPGFKTLMCPGCTGIRLEEFAACIICKKVKAEKDDDLCAECRDESDEHEFWEDADYHLRKTA